MTNRHVHGAGQPRVGCEGRRGSTRRRCSGGRSCCRWNRRRCLAGRGGRDRPLAPPRCAIVATAAAATPLSPVGDCAHVGSAVEHTRHAHQRHGSHSCRCRSNGSSNGGAAEAVDVVELLRHAHRRDARCHSHRASHARAPRVQNSVSITQQHIEERAQGRARHPHTTGTIEAVATPHSLQKRRAPIGSCRQRRQPNIRGVGGEQRHDGGHLTKCQEARYIRHVHDDIHRAAVQ